MDGFIPDLEAWDAWRPEEISTRLTGIDLPWYVAGGWAIDLFLGGQRREHDDLEIAVPADRFGELRSVLPELEFFVVGDGRAWALADRDALLDAHHQTWGRDPVTRQWRIDVFREPHQGDIWISRRDPLIRMPYRDLIRRTPEGIPYGAPEAMLLFKAKANRPKDNDDFLAALPRMDARARIWLRDAMELVHPNHPWLTTLP